MRVLAGASARRPLIAAICLAGGLGADRDRARLAVVGRRP